MRRATHHGVALVPHQQFLSTLSLRRATAQGFSALHDILISIHALLAESDAATQRLFRCYPISIHALLAESDYMASYPQCITDISIHALLAESDLFLRSGRMMRRYFYPRSPCGERQRDNRFSRRFCHFYPRSPCGERPPVFYGAVVTFQFLSTLSLRRATGT